MPRVPTYDGPQLREAPLNPAFQGNIDVSSGGQALAAGVGEVGAAIDRIQQRQATSEALNLETSVKADWLATDAELRKKYRGANTTGYLEEVKKWWDDAPQKYAGAATPLAQQLVGKSLKQYQMQAVGASAAYLNGEQEKALDAGYTSNLFVTTQAAVKDITPATAEGARVATVNAINTAVARYGAAKGWSTEQVQAEQLRQAGTFTGQAVTNLALSDPAAARDFLQRAHDAGQIDAKDYAVLGERVKVAANAAQAQQVGAMLAAKYNYTQTTDAIKEIDGMAGVTPDQKAAIRTELEHRHAVMQSDADKAQAQGVSQVMEMLYSGASKAQIVSSPVFQGLRDKGAALKAIDDKAYSDVLRANANDARAIAALQRHETELRLNNAASAFALSDPEVLAATPREKIAALLPVLGQTWTQDLLQKKDAFERKDAKTLQDAKFDFDDIKSVAKEFFSLDASNLSSKSDKAAFMDFKSRAERVVVSAQEKAGRALTREEKYDLIAKEAARTVKTGGIGGFFQDDTPVMQLTQTQFKELTLPAAQIEPLRAEMAKLYAVAKNPIYADTPDNLKRYYLTRISPTGAAAVSKPQQ